jgi:hypothetical protein
MKREYLGLIACLLLTGCAAVEHFDKESPPEYLTVRRAEFFRSGPAQAFPPEKLEKDLPLSLLKKDSGYAFVRLLDNRTGYVAFSDLRAAPPVAEGASAQYDRHVRSLAACEPGGATGWGLRSLDSGALEGPSKCKSAHLLKS